MSDIIKDFAKQAGFKVDWQHEDVQSIKMAQYKEFAELVIQECMRVVVEGGEMKQTAHYYRKRIKDHFGVQ